MRPCKLLPKLECLTPTECGPTVCSRIETPLIDVVLPDRPAEGAPARWSEWQHRNGQHYVVLMVTNESDRQDEYPATVVYMGVHNGARWSRKLCDWHRSMTLQRQWTRPEVMDFLATEIPDGSL